MEKKINPEDRKYKCEICGKEFLSTQKVNERMPKLNLTNHGLPVTFVAVLQRNCLTFTRRTKHNVAVHCSVVLYQK